MNQFSDKTISFIGPGEMGSALVRVMVERKVVQPDKIMVGARRQEPLDIIKNENGVRITKDFRQAVEFGDIIILTVSFSGCAGILESIKDLVKDKIFIIVSVPIDPEKVTRLMTPEHGSAAETAEKILGEDAKVVAAFQNIATSSLANPSELSQRDVLVCGKNKTAKQTVIELIQLMGMRGLDAGALSNARVIEGLTVVLIGMNIRYKKKNMGIKITGI